ncbi:MAG: serine hydrolase domain-containing protein [Alphaproteobacteria bacterium]
MEPWLKPALAYLESWLDHQMRVSRQPGCQIAVAHDGKLVLERAYGRANLVTGEKLTTRHRFRVASHSKTFTTVGVLRLREQGKLRLDDPVGRYVDGLHPDVAETTISQLLSHGAGLIRDGEDAGQWQNRRPFASERELRAALAEPPTLPANERFKYSNHGYGLVGLAVEAITGQPFRDWIKAEVVDRAGLKATVPDMPLPEGAKLVSGHSSEVPLGKRVLVPGDADTAALTPATGFVSTASDIALFFNQIDPDAKRSILSAASRREMVRRHRRNEPSSVPSWYGLGTMQTEVDGWRCVGHGGGFPSTLSRTATILGQGLTVSILTNAVDGWANPWSDSALRILRRFAKRGAPPRRLRDWSGRWWGLWGCVDLVPMGERVYTAPPGMMDPFADAGEIEVTGKDVGRIAEANGLSSPGEPASLQRDKRGRVTAVWLAGTKLLPEARLAAELRRRYEG